MATQAIGELTLGEFARQVRPSRGRRLWRLAGAQPLGVVSLVVLLAYVAIAVFAPVVATRDPYANDAALTYKRGDLRRGAAEALERIATPEALAAVAKWRAEQSKSE